MASAKHKRVQIIGILEEREALLETLRKSSGLTLGEQAELSGSELLFLQEATVPTAQETELVKALEALPCAFIITDPPEAGGGLFGKRKRAEGDIPPAHGLDKVKDRLLERTQTQIKALQAETDKRTAEITAKFTEEADHTYWKHATAGKQTIDQTAQGLADTAAMESRKKVLAFKQELVEKAFDLSLDRLSELPEEKYIKFLVSLCVKASQSGSERLIFSMRDRGHYGKRVTIAANEMLESQGRPAKLTMSEETRPIRGGVILTDGLVDVNCSVEALIEARRRELLIPVAETLFE